MVDHFNTELEGCMATVKSSAMPASDEMEDDDDAPVVEILDKDGRIVHLLGTAHVSRKSCEDVSEVIKRVRPQVVAVELCRSREFMLHPMDKDVEMTIPILLKRLRQRDLNLFALLYGWFLSTISKQLEVPPGSEFRVAYEEAQDLDPPATVVLVDRPVNVTVARAWAGLGRVEKLRLCWHLIRDIFNLPGADELRQLVEDLKHKDVLTEAMKEFGKFFPGMVRPLMTERDLFLSYMLYEQAGRMKVGDTMVAVVGAGHVPGIKEHWGQPINVSELLKMPVHKMMSPASRMALGLVAGASIAGVLVGTVLISAQTVRIAFWIGLKLTGSLRARLQALPAGHS